MNDKKYTSDVESKRLDIEEPERTYGARVLPQQVWRDGALIPGSPKKLSFRVPELEDGHVVSYAYFDDIHKTMPLVKKVEKLELSRVTGVENVWQNDELKNMIGREFDDENLNSENSWQFILYSDGNELSYGVGEPLIDIRTGVLKFRDDKFLEAVKDETISITFYKYVGRTGFFGSDSGADLPIRDDIALLKSSANDNVKARFHLSGAEGETAYILPKAGNHFVARTLVVDEYGKTKAVSSNEGTVMLEENYQEIDWNIGLHNGGVWLPDSNVETN